MTCPICRGEATGSRRFLSRGEEDIDLCRCRDCQLEFLRPQPSNALLAREYARYYVRRSGKRAGLRAKQPYFEKLLRAAAGPRARATCLEIGAGEGDCVAAVNEIWPDCVVTALEGNPESAVYFRDLQCRYVNEGVDAWLAKGTDEQFDLILMFDLLEHLRDPIRTLQALTREHLRDGGWLIATLPNSDSWSRRLMGRSWLQYKLEHLFYFSAPSIGELEGRTGLRRVRLAPLYKKLPIGYLLSVGSSFGPEPAQRVISRLASFVPDRVGDVSLTLPLGEWIWISEKPARSG